VLLSSLLIAGCGTVANLVKPGPEDGKVPFGGVREDEWWIEKAAAGEFGCGKDTSSKPGSHPQLAIALLCAADWPFSFLGDVLTWPYTAAYTFINQPTPVVPVILATTEIPPPPPLPQPEPGSTSPKSTPPKSEEGRKDEPEKKSIPPKSEERRKDEPEKKPGGISAQPGDYLR
jgi:hypothetical protein